MDQTGPERIAAPEMHVEEADALLERNGITRVRADQFHVGGYRYGNITDALAQVARGAGGRRG